jgi:SHS2 domain-containing protein
MIPRYELFDHTADIGIRAVAPSLPDLIEPCTAGLYAVIGTVAAAGDARPWRFEAASDDAALLLRDYLAEVLLLFDTEHRRLTGLHVTEFTPQRLCATADARPVDTRHSVLQREVKAVTYHELAVRPVAGGYEATCIVDI